jgi:hypothetical protein
VAGQWQGEGGWGLVAVLGGTISCRINYLPALPPVSHPAASLPAHTLSRVWSGVQPERPVTDPHPQGRHQT